jgi:hypothetical protein
MAILFVGHPHFGAKRQGFVGRRQRVIVEGDAAGSFRSMLRRIAGGPLVGVSFDMRSLFR